MRFFLPLFALASAFGIATANPVNVARQEAIRYGVVNVSPPTVKFGELMTITYNSTRARYQPITLDVYLQGTILSNNFKLPYYQLGRFNDYGNSTSLTFQTTLPVLYTSPTHGYDEGTGFDIWAFITYHNPDGGAVVVGGVATGLGVDLSD